MAYARGMTYESIKELSISTSAFRQSVGLERNLFTALVNVLAQAESAKKR